MPSFFVGLDLGQMQDFTALAVLERVEGDDGGQRAYHVRHLHRFKLGTPYPDIAEDVAYLLRLDPLAGQSRIAVDATGVGAPVVDLLRQSSLGAPLTSVTITGADSVSIEGRSCRVPKRDLVSVLQVLLQTGRLKVAKALPEAATLVHELLAFQVRINPRTARDSYGCWREGVHDDLVLAVAMACWLGERCGSVPTVCVRILG